MTLRAGLRDFVSRVVTGSSLGHRHDEAVALIDLMTAGWAERAPTGAPYISYLARDGTPFEPSVRMCAGAPSELRWVIEAQPEPPSLETSAYFGAAMALDDRLAARGLIDLTPVRAIADVFASALPKTTAALWFGAALGASGPPLIKNYFVCSLPGQWLEVFARLGLSDVAVELAPRLRGTKVEFVSVDLAPGHAHSRVKLYVRHRFPDAPIDCAAIDAVHGASPSHVPGDAHTLVRGLFGEVPSVRKLGPISTFHIERGAITHSALNVPLEPLHYTTAVPSDDLAIAMNIARLAHAWGVPIDPLYAQMLGVAMNDGVRYPHHRYCGMQRRAGRVELTVYLSTLLQARHHGMRYGPLRLA